MYNVNQFEKFCFRFYLYRNKWNVYAKGCLIIIFIQYPCYTHAHTHICREVYIQDKRVRDAKYMDITYLTSNESEM